MAITLKQFNVRVPSLDYQSLTLELSDLVGVRPLYRNWDGRRYVTLPAPFEALRIFDGDTLTKRECKLLGRAIRFLFDTGTARPTEESRRAMGVLTTTK